MTLKLGIFGALLATGLIAGAGQAKADGLRVQVRPAPAAYVQPVPVRGAGWQPRYHGPVVPTPAINRGYGYGYGAPAVVRTGQRPSRFARQVRADLDQATEELRFDVRQGMVEPRALAML